MEGPLFLGASFRLLVSWKMNSVSLASYFVGRRPFPDWGRELRGASVERTSERVPLPLAGMGSGRGTGRESGMPRSGKDSRTLWTLQLAKLPKLVSGPVPRFPVFSSYLVRGSRYFINR